jgi:hypothetical protein
LVFDRCRRVPEVRFLGADSVIVPLKDSLNANLAKWDRKKMPRGNLEAVLGIEFPPPKVCRHSHCIYFTFPMIYALISTVVPNIDISGSTLRHHSCRRRDLIGSLGVEGL